MERIASWFLLTMCCLGDISGRFARACSRSVCAEVPGTSATRAETQRTREAPARRRRGSVTVAARESGQRPDSIPLAGRGGTCMVSPLRLGPPPAELYGGTCLCTGMAVPFAAI